jgi:hypothetical protein
MKNKKPGRLLRSVAKGMSRSPGDVDERVGPFRNLVGTKDECDLAIENVVGLVAVDVNMRWRHASTRWQGSLHKRESTIRRRGSRLEVHDTTSGFLSMAFTRTEDVVRFIRHLVDYTPARRQRFLPATLAPIRVEPPDPGLPLLRGVTLWPVSLATRRTWVFAATHVATSAS